MNAFRADLLQCEGLLETSYIWLTATLQTLDGPNLDFLKQLKEGEIGTYDPKAIFDLVISRLT